MPIKTTITTATTWTAAAGTDATGGNTGLADPSLLKHGVDPITGERFLTAGTGGGAYFRIEGGEFSTSDDYTARFDVEHERLFDTVTNGGASPFPVSFFFGTTPQIRIVGETTPATNERGGGSILTYWDGAPGGASIWSRGYPRQGWQTFNKRFELTLHVNVAGGVGKIAVFANREVVMTASGINLAGWTKNSNPAWYCIFQGTTGVRTKIFGAAAHGNAIVTYSGTDAPRGRLTSDRACDFLHKTYMIGKAASGTSEGYGTAPDVAANYSVTPYVTGGVNPDWSRAVLSGALTLTGDESIGALPFNKYGWATLAWRSVYVPTGTASLAIRNAADTADVLKLNIASGQLRDAAGVQLLASDGTPVTVSTANRYQLVVNLNSDGRAAFTLQNQSVSPASGRTVWSNRLANWTPQALGKPKWIGSAATIEHDALGVWRWLWLPGFDSMTSAAITPANGTPALNVPNYVGAGFAMTDSCAVPRINYPLGDVGMPWAIGWHCWGYAGLNRLPWLQNVLRHMTHTYGVCLQLLDGFAINDSSSITAAAQLNYTREVIDWAKAHASQCVVSYVTTRGAAGTSPLSDAQRIFCADYNRGLEAAYRASYESDPDVRLVRPESAYAPQSAPYAGGDGTHPVGTAANLIAIGSVPDDLTKPLSLTSDAGIAAAVTASLAAGVKLAGTQELYAPAKAGDAMALTSPARLAIVTAFNDDPTQAQLRVDVDIARGAAVNAQTNSSELVGMANAAAESLDALGTDIADVAVDVASLEGELDTIGTGTLTMLGKLSGITSVGNWLRALARKGTADATALVEIGGGFTPATDSLEAQADRTIAGVGLSDAHAAQLDAVKRSTDKITLGGFSVVEPVTPSLTIRRGDSYTTTSGQVRDVVRADGDQWPTSFTGWTVELTADRVGGATTTGAITFAAPLAVLIDTADDQTLRLVGVPAEDTAALAPGEWAYRAVATKGDEVNTLREGVLVVEA